MNKNNLGYVLLPLALTLGIVGGIFIGKVMNTRQLSPTEEKWAALMALIEDEYVDTVNVDSLLEKSIPDLMAMLDPHSVYIPKSELTAVNEELESSFSGIGISFQILNDSVVVVEVIPGGPAEKAGIQPGDRVVAAGKQKLTGKSVSNELVFKTLRGPQGSQIKLEIARSSSKKPISFEIERDQIPVNSVDAVYMATPETGYLKVSKFGTSTYDEFLNALTSLQKQGAKSFIVDLRGNSGGYMDQAIFMANEFLEKGRMIVYSKGRSAINETLAVSDGNGSFQKSPITVLIDEYSASASEIFAGAIQDNDRGTIIGRRSFGKGLVQNQTLLPDSSAVRLTVARYYTPSGRCIQKDYKRNESGRYELDILDRYNHGEFYSSDSIKLDKSKKFKTVGGRTVYGGGGIMPDIFVPQDTAGFSSWYIAVSNAGLIQKYAFQVVEKYRPVLKSVKSLSQLYNVIPRDETLLQGLVSYAAANGIPARWYYINMSRNVILSQLKAVIARDVLGYSAMIRALNATDPTVQKAIQQSQKTK